MNEVDVIAPIMPETLSSVVTELDNPVLAARSRDRELDVWETVAFPDAIIDVRGLPEGESIDIVASLEHQNHTLRDRVSYLETTLSQAQSHLCQEVARWESLALRGDERLQEAVEAQEQTIAQYVNELTDTQQKVAQLFAQLEHSHQTAQRQQIIMETLNTQLRNSQERVAQLERECVGVHQKNVDQAQQILQQAHQVQDLQSRLQRQQRYTLQYKAALEKSLDVTPPPVPAAPALLSETTANQLAAKAVTMPKPCPVKPWSAPEAATADSQKAWLNAFLSDSAEFPSEHVLANFDWQPSQPIDPTPVSFNLAALPEDGQIALDVDCLADPEPRLDGWETVATGASPFITLQATAIDAETEAETEPAPKRESLAAVDLPMFAKADAPI